jgi:small subunit ribosomal protein S1
MNSSTDPSTPEPTAAERVPRSSVESAAPVGEHASESQAARKSTSIRIGTQRYGVKVPPAVPRPVLPNPPEALLSKPTALVEPNQEQPVAESAATRPLESTENAAGSAVSHEPAAAAAAVVATAAVTSTAPGARAKGSKKDSKSRAPRFIPETAPRHIEPPNIRAELPPELELEYIEALGGASLDEMIAGQGAAPVELELESRHKAKVVRVHRDNVFVEIGRAQGLVPLKNFSAEHPPEPGTLLDVVVTRFNAAEGLYELNLPGASVDVGDWSEVAEGMVVDARVTGHNKGGLECEVNRLRGFIPASQVSMYRVEDLAQFVDQKFACVITEVNPEKRNLVLSRRAVLEREKAAAKEQLLASLEPGQTHEGTVRSLQNFGAFVDLGGVDGLIHISQLSWDRIKHASEVLEIGQKVKVKIQKIDPNTGKISLAFRDLSESPWANAGRDFPARSRVKGTVSRLMEFGAFVRLTAGVEGLVHISELSHKRVFRVSDVLSEGQDVEVLVLSVDPEAQRISLSLKALEARASAAEKGPVDAESDEPLTPSEPPKKRKTPLKGGIGGPPSGEKFGLNW